MSRDDIQTRTITSLLGAASCIHTRQYIQLKASTRERHASITDYYLATLSGRPIIELTKPARHGTVKPSVVLVDMTKNLILAVIVCFQTICLKA